MPKCYQNIQTILNYYGIIPDYVDIHQRPLPDVKKMRRYRGVFVWFRSSKIEALDDEASARKNARRSLVAKNRIPKGKAIDKNDLSFSTSINWSKNENEVTDLYGTSSIGLTGASISSRAIVGHPLGVLYGTGSKTKADGSLDLNANGFPQITSGPIVLGDPNPDWRGGAGLSASYKGFDFNILFETFLFFNE